MPAYLALSTTPTITPTGEVTRTKTGEDIRWHRVSYWRELGTINAKDDLAALQQAKDRFGGSPVIQAIKTH